MRKLLLIELLLVGLSMGSGGLSSNGFFQLIAASRKEPLIAILPVKPSKAELKNYAESLSKALYIAGKRARSFALVDKALIDKQASAISDFSDVEKISEVGSQWGANYVLAVLLEDVAFSEKGDEVIVSLEAKAFSPEHKALIYRSRKEVAAGGMGFQGSQQGLIQQAFNKLTGELFDDFFKSVTRSFMVLNNRQGSITVNAGERSGLRPGVEFLVWKENQPVARLGNCAVGIGSSTCEVVSIYIPGERIEIGDDVSLLFNPSKAEKKKESLARKIKKNKTLMYALIGAAVVGAVLALGKKGGPAEGEVAITKVKVSGITATPTKNDQGEAVIKLNWQESADPSVTGYFVFCAAGDESGPTEEFKLIADTQTMSGVPPLEISDCGGAARFRKFRQRPFKGGFARSKLIEDITYWFRVAAHDAQGRSGPLSDLDPEASAVAGELPPPDPPILVDATPGGSKVTLTWEPPKTRDDGTFLDPDSELDGYNIYLSSDGGATFTLITFQQHDPDTDAKDTQTRTITELENNVVYHFQLEAVDKDGRKSVRSNTKIAMPTLAPPPPPPENLQTIAGDGSVQLSWDNPQTFIDQYNIVQYNIYRGTDASNLSVIATKTVGSLSDPAIFNDNTVVNGTTYFYAVSSVNDEGTEGKKSTPVEATPETTLAPLKPSNLVWDQTQPKDQEVTLQWTAENLDVVGEYRIYRSSISKSDLFGNIQNGTVYKTKQVNSQDFEEGQTITFTDIGLTNGTTYYYAVTAVSKKNGKESDPATVTATPEGPAVPGQVLWDPSNPVVPGGDVITLSWQPVADAKYYCIWRRDITNNLNLAFYAQVDRDKTTFADTSVVADTIYGYRVSAVSFEATACPASLDDSTTEFMGPLSEEQQTTTTALTIQLLNPAPSVTVQGTPPSAIGGQDGSATITFEWGQLRTENINYVVEVAFLGNSHTGFSDDQSLGRCTNDHSGVPKDMSNILEVFNTEETQVEFNFDNRSANDYFFHWRVKAFNDLGQLVAESTICDLKVTIPVSTAALPPDPPENLVVSSVDRDTLEITLSFDQPADTPHCVNEPEASPCITSYRIYRCDVTASVACASDSDFVAVNEISAGTTTSGITVTNKVQLTTTHRFAFKVSAVGSDGTESSKVIPDLARVEVYSSNAPGIVNSNDVTITPGNSQVTIEWPFNAVSTKDIKGFVICRSTSTNENTFISLADNVTPCSGAGSITDAASMFGVDIPVNVPFDPSRTTNYQFVDTDVQNGTIYYYRIATVNFANLDPYPTSCNVCNLGSGSGQPASLSGFLQAKPLSNFVPEFGADLTFGIGPCADGNSTGTGLAEETCLTGDPRRGMPLLTWTWSQEPDDVFGYGIERDETCTFSSANTPIAIVPAKGAGQVYNFVDTDPVLFDPDSANNAFGTNICYRIFAFIDKDGDFAFTSADPRNSPTGPTTGTQFVTPFTEKAPPAPTNVTLTPDNGKITVSWDEPGNLPSDVVGYWVFFRHQSSGSSPPTEDDFLSSGNCPTDTTDTTNTPLLVNASFVPSSGAGSTLTLTHSSLTNGDEYYYKVKTMRYQPGGETSLTGATPVNPTSMDERCGSKLGFSDFSSGIVGAMPQKTPVGDIVEWQDIAIVSMEDRIQLQWQTPSTSDLAGFKIYRATGSNGQKSNFTPITTGSCANPPASATTCQDTQANDPNVVYYYRIAIVNSDGSEGPMNEERFGSPKSQVVVLLSPENNQTFATEANIFEWQAVQGATAYKLEMGNDANLDTATIYYQCIMTFDPNDAPAGGDILTAQYDPSDEADPSTECTSSNPAPISSDEFEVGNPPSTVYWRVKAQQGNVLVACSNNCLGQPYNFAP